MGVQKSKKKIKVFFMLKQIRKLKLKLNLNFSRKNTKSIFLI